MESIWQSIQKSLLLGTNRANLPERTRQMMKAFPLKLTGGETNLLLRSLSFFHYLRKGAMEVPQLEELPAKAPLEEMPLPGPKLSRMIERMLEEEALQAVFPEYVDLALGHQLQLPYETLPHLFDLFHKDWSKVEQIQSVMGNRGIWLSRQNPDWIIFSPIAIELDWENAGIEERFQYLKKLRQIDPINALSILQSGWDQESTRNQLRLLVALKENLTEADLPFLQQCLQAKEQMVRRLAGRLIALLPETEHQLDLLSLLYLLLEADDLGSYRPWLFLDQDALRSLLIRIGYYQAPGPKHISNEAIGEILPFITLQMPPRFWESFFEKDLSSSFEVLQQSSFYNKIKNALAQSIYWHQDWAWMETLLHPLLDLESERWNTEPILKLAANLPLEVFERLSLSYIRFHKNIIASDSLLFYMLKEAKHPWPDGLSIGIVRLFQDYLLYSKSYFRDEATHYEELLTSLSIKANPDLFTELQVGWPQGSFSWYQWEPTIQKMLRILHFRKELHQLIKEQ